MKRIFIITLCVCLVLSMGVSVCAADSITEERPQFSRENMPQRGQFNPGNMPTGERPQRQQNITTTAENTENEQTAVPPEVNAQQHTAMPEESNVENTNPPNIEDIPNGGRQFPQGMRNPMNGMPTETQAEAEPTGFYGFLKTYSTPVTSVVLLGLAFLFVIFYKRKNY